MASNGGVGDGSESSNKNSSSRVLYTVKCIVNRKEVGIIIGKGGENVKKLRKESGARVTISEGSEFERLVIVTGTTAQLQNAFTNIAEKLQADLIRHGQSSGNVMFRLVVSYAHCGMLIGKNGTNIKELRKTTGANVQVSNEILPNSTERDVSVSGDIESVVMAIEKIAVLSTQMLRYPVIPYQPGMMDYMRCRALLSGPSDGLLDDPHPNSVYDQQLYRGAYKRTSMNSNNSAFHSAPSHMGSTLSHMLSGPTHMLSGPTHMLSRTYNTQHMQPGILGAGPMVSTPSVKTITKEIRVSSDSVGALIGRHGNRIRDVRQCTGASVVIEEGEERGGERKVKVSGDPASVRSATFIIKNICSRPKPADSSSPTNDD